MLDGVGDEVPACLREPQRVTGHERGRGRPQRPAVPVGECAPGGRGVRDEATEVDGLAATRAARTRKVVERQRRPPQLEVDRLDPRRALEIPERESRDRQRPAHLVLRPAASTPLAGARV